MTFQQEFASWWSAGTAPVAEPAPKIGESAPSSNVLQLPSNKKTVVAFLRHCGCPFAEQTFLRMREAAKTHGDIDFIAVSHSDKASTDNWHKSLPNATEPPNLSIVVDDKREAYAKWGLGVSGFAHVLSPGVFSNVFKLGKEQGISNRPTETGTRWQTSGTFAVGGDGRVKWGGPAARADEVPDFEEIVKRLSA